MRILVLSTFDVWPPRDGGQNRYVNLWRNFSPEHEITILAYDFRNLVGERRYRLADHVEVIVPPASADDARHFHHVYARTGLWTHDILCTHDYQFSTEFLQQLAMQVRTCDVLVASHPYLASVAFPMASNSTRRVYESHNVEFDIKAGYLRSSIDQTLADELLSAVKRCEGFAARSSHCITAVSEADKTRLTELYNLNPDSIIIVPNGTNIRQSNLLGAPERQEVRVALGVGDDPIGIFLGSSFAANVESYKRSRVMLDTAGFRGVMLLVGAIAEANRGDWPEVKFEERWLGFVSADVRDVLLSTADFAMHLMFSGAGTNLKLFDYMGAGVPIIANGFGRRGVEEAGWCLSAETTEELAQAIERAATNNNTKCSEIARDIAIDRFDWKRISKRFEDNVCIKSNN